MRCAGRIRLYLCGDKPRNTLTATIMNDKFTFRAEWLEAIRLISDPEVRAMASMAIIEYGIHGTAPADDAPEQVRVIMALVMPQIDAANRRRKPAKRPESDCPAPEASCERGQTQDSSPMLLDNFDDIADYVISRKDGEMGRWLADINVGRDNPVDLEAAIAAFRDMCVREDTLCVTDRFDKFLRRLEPFLRYDCAAA